MISQAPFRVGPAQMLVLRMGMCLSDRASGRRVPAGLGILFCQQPQP